MNMLISEIQALAANPFSWIAVALMLVVAGHSVGLLMRCPYSHGTATISDEEQSQAQMTVFAPGTRFGLMMLLGIGLTIGGLFMIASGTKPAMALIAMVSGLIITQTEPIRLQIREGKSNVIASRDSDEITSGLMRDRLRAGHKELAVTNMLMLFALTAGLLAF